MDSNLIDGQGESEFKLVGESVTESESESESAHVSEPTPKRGRGRPRKTDANGAPVSNVKIETKVTRKKSAAVKTDVAGLAIC
jgi:AT hook motif.